MRHSSAVYPPLVTGMPVNHPDFIYGKESVWITERLIWKMPEGFDRLGWKIPPAMINILAIPEDVNVPVEKELPASQSIQRLIDGEITILDSIGEFIHIECAIRSAIGGNEHVDIEIDDGEMRFQLFDHHEVDVPERIAPFDPDIGNRHFHPNIEQQEMPLGRSQVRTGNPVTRFHPRQDISVPQPITGDTGSHQHLNVLHW